jgi:hypothetical protein
MKHYDIYKEVKASYGIIQVAYPRPAVGIIQATKTAEPVHDHWTTQATMAE